MAIASLIGSAQTFTTVASGNWTNPSIWAGGVAPSNVIAPGMVVNIRHEVSCNLTSDISLEGRLNVLGDTLRFPVTFAKNINVVATGQLVVLNGGLITNVPANQCNLVVLGGYVRFDNARIAIGKNFTAIAGGRRFVKNSKLIIGEHYLADGGSLTPVRDTLVNTNIVVSASHSGNFELKNYSHLRLANVRLTVTNGDLITGSNSSLSLFAGPQHYFGFIVMKVQHNLEVSGPWDARVDAYCIDNDINGSMMLDIDFTRPEDCTLTPTPSTLGQMVINEVYTDPGSGNHEFIELYNVSSKPEAVNNYTLVTYYEEHVNGVTEKGFYTLDFPDFTVAARSFLVGAAAKPFNYQSFNNSDAANFNWNAISNTSSGSLRKWVRSAVGGEADGNVYYDEKTLPAAGLNDLFHRLTGDNSFTFFLFKNGILVNQIIAGSGGTNGISTTITTMPPLYVDMAGSSPDFTVHFSTFAGMPVEKINQDAGSDNGFIRTTDGGCGSWKKSSAGSTHTPNQANGPLVAGVAGDVALSCFITRGTPETGSKLTYKVLSASTNSFAVEMRVYLDNGPMPGQFDLGDVLIDVQLAYTNQEAFTKVFQPYDADILIVVKQGSGCVDNITHVQQASFVVLPVNFNSFTALYENKDVLLSWSVADTKGLPQFTVQRSTDGKDFIDIAAVLSEEATTSFKYKDKAPVFAAGVNYYRIKAVNKFNAVYYSQVRAVTMVKENSTLQITAYPNPVSTQLAVALPADWKSKQVSIQLLNASGVVVHQRSALYTGQKETLIVSDLIQGLYIVKATCGSATASQRILKL